MGKNPQTSESRSTLYVTDPGYFERTFHPVWMTA